jgi:hypothetical protein
MAEPERPDRSFHRAAALASLRCSFCGKPGDEVRSIVCGPTPAVAICDECVDLCDEIIREQLAGPAPDEPPAAA